jgi:L-gulonate 5-dehydrogenase
MRAFQSTGPKQLSLETVPDPVAPGAHEILLRPLAVGICGSDLHFLERMSPASSGSGSPPRRIQGHEFCAEVLESSSSRLRSGDRVAVLPGIACGHCYPCVRGRRGACENLRIIGFHQDGGLAERIVVPEENCVPIGDLEQGLAAFIEPMSIALHAVARPSSETGEHAVVLGAGPIGQATAHALTVMGVSVAIVDPLERRRTLGLTLGAEKAFDASDSLVDEVHEWLGGVGPEIVFDASGVPGTFPVALDIVRQCGRVLIVGLADGATAFPASLPVHKELDIMGASCCSEHEFQEAATFVEHHAKDLAPLISHRFAFADTSEAFALAYDEPEQVMKIVIEL